MGNHKTVHQVFKTIIILKGIHAIVEILLGLLLLVLTHQFISDLIVIIVEGRLAGDPTGFLARYVTQFGIDLSLSIKLFFAVYLITHGIINLSLVYGVVKRPSFAYPISLVLFVGFVVYQIYEYIVLSSLWLLMITLVDVLFIGLVMYEYNAHLKTHSFLGKLKLIVKAKVPRIIEL